MTVDQVIDRLFQLVLPAKNILILTIIISIVILLASRETCKQAMLYEPIVWAAYRFYFLSRDITDIFPLDTGEIDRTGGGGKHVGGRRSPPNTNKERRRRRSG
eukprot:CAMPEP_0117022060 /NCGR_PEP_ID=MMETSP0472-20121206/16621_1 /TAXON_ID=693140 ORGANISM="Tiarina fusus, Strain LIS" /NCGR_SAMPLE_ID=MMETSP0472 /ASSEMBLY_ACC=CAM_ASM_000603 /LENGTH=102 /DNA_ID=CAMNT_0004727813 /DNA_START=143 /DNA_END=447 /DNA_ORIENTATION=+